MRKLADFAEVGEADFGEADFRKADFGEICQHLCRGPRIAALFFPWSLLLLRSNPRAKPLWKLVWLDLQLAFAIGIELGQPDRLWP